MSRVLAPIFNENTKTAKIRYDVAMNKTMAQVRTYGRIERVGAMLAIALKN
jgi:hypothetical protein